MLMSLVSSAKSHDLDVWKYVKDVLDQLLAGETDYGPIWGKANMGQGQYGAAVGGGSSRCQALIRLNRCQGQ